MSHEAAESWVVKFIPLASSVESSFWVKYSEEKLNKIQLKEDPIDISGSYGNDSRLECRENSLSPDDVHQSRVMMKGQLVGYNTVETFQKIDKNQFIRNVFLPLFNDGNICTFVVLTFADLKNHKILYWFAMPAIATQKGCSIRATHQEEVKNGFSSSELKLLYDSFSKDVWNALSLPSFFLYTKNSGCLPFTRKSYDMLCSKDGSERIIFCFLDSPSRFQKEQFMGWQMRNMVAFLSLHWGLSGQTVQIISFRPKFLRSTMEQCDDMSVFLHVTVPTKADYGDDLQVVGWEPNVRGKPGPRWVNLQPLLDNRHLAIQAADLNLKLMKWRMIPSLDVEKLQATKVLLLGAGTLGCNVARTLLGWGIRNFKIVDNGKVSYSNPVRQSLFTLKDCQGGEGGGGIPKAVAAAQALREIAADVEAEAFVLSIPMPGHAETQETINASVEQLDQLIKECDVVYLLTDTRESRWLPTVIAASHNKMLINAALGLDSWLVMRHGGDTRGENSLGCYFCNDVVAPENSMKNRTLDQQCTVTRPGLAPIAGSMAVELMVSLLQHPDLHHAPAPRNSSSFSPTTTDTTASPLGVMPHQIRGSLVSYTIMNPTVPAFSCCTGCSPDVVNAYESDGADLVYQAAQSASGTYLEDITGLTAFRAEAEDQLDGLEEDWDIED
mmetsp:Transcript_12211/g.17902  ORF Transcript_12211/g.17902 Transcript_12211/m.17902 type:complete len:668 (+) Transcript_12211:144-2147(+)|eukprot:CAMPEP_0194222604 /NCGR_PEP_ID=MMETSP0156-20130528/33327_1 /TAXON_ID=33649 /ORGANISM="Thalassionema nitzschioides, Strain L26-B" /LENGTH=667 /DNA_ID=CAMNT_0038953461 /DNA_START=95 /DNA_END=2098 /DNA_ORIENTATION=-